MDNTDLTRRKLLAVTGATVALAACNQSKPETGSRAKIASGPGECPNMEIKRADPQGTWPHCGENPNNPELSTDFTPDFITLVWIDCGNDWNLKIRSSSFTFDSSVDIKNFVKNTFNRMHANSNPNFHALGGHPLAIHGNSDKEQFKGFGFHSKHRIYFYFNSSNVDVIQVDSYDSSGNPQGNLSDHIFAFSPYSSSGKPVYVNNGTFKNGRKIPKTEINLNGLLLTIDNHYLDPNNVPMKIDPSENRSYQYSMNIYFKINVGGRPVVMMLDPDTGNGVGWQP